METIEFLTQPVVGIARTAEPGGDGVTVFIHDDDLTPDDYVMLVLRTVFELSHELAEHITWVAHTEGVAPVVTRSRDEAESLVNQARECARLYGFPLAFGLEKELRSFKRDYRKSVIQLVLYGILSILLLTAASLASADTSGGSGAGRAAPGPGARLMHERVTSEHSGILNTITVTGITNSLCGQMKKAMIPKLCGARD